MTSSRPGTERLLLSYLDDLHAPLAALQIIGRRLDVSFLRQLTKKIGPEPTPIVRSNLKRIESIPWIASNLSMLDALREGEQPGVVHLAVSSAAPRQQVLEVVAYILRHGKVMSRRIAAKALADFSGPTADELVIHLMDDEDAVVRAAVASQLRPRNLPGAIQRLLQLLESPHEVERDVAQAALAEFTLERFAANFEQMSPQNRFATGLLIRRVDPTAIPHLRSEIEAPSRGRRVRALELTVAIGGVELLQEPIAALIKDDDQFLRMEAIRTLATIDTPMSRQALRDAMLDTQPLVQQAAESALAAMPRSEAPMTPAIAAEAARETVQFSAIAEVAQ
jgi:HEAT repeat protein